jgi:phasin
MAMNPSEPFQIPPEMRAFAEKSVEQARQAFDGYLAAAQRTVSMFEGQAESARKGVKDVSAKALEFAEHNVASSLELAQKMIRAKDAQEVMELQASYIRAQMQALTQQARELGESATKAANDSVKPGRD